MEGSGINNSYIPTNSDIVTDDVNTVGINISTARFKGKPPQKLYIEIKQLAEQKLSAPTISKILEISPPSCYNLAKRYNDYTLIKLLKVNGINNKSKMGRGKGIQRSTKGKTYLEIFKGDINKAESRAKITSDWMKINNIRKYCKAPSKSQVMLLELINYSFNGEEITLEYPIYLSNNNQKTIWLDVAIPKLKLNFECDGEYWHNLNNKNKGITDNIRDKIITELGWHIFRLSDKEIRKLHILLPEHVCLVGTMKIKSRYEYKIQTEQIEWLKNKLNNGTVTLSVSNTKKFFGANPNNILGFNRQKAIDCLANNGIYTRLIVSTVNKDVTFIQLRGENNEKK